MVIGLIIGFVVGLVVGIKIPAIRMYLTYLRKGGMG